MAEKKANKILTILAEVATVENFQKYILGSKKSGQPRAVYDVVRDYTKPKKKKKGKKGASDNTYGLYLELKKGKKKHGKKKRDKFWHI